MARKKNALFIAAGSGYCVDKNSQIVSLLSTSIKHVNPDYTVFFITNECKEIIDFIKENIKDDYDEFVENEDYELVLIEDIDDFNSCCQTISKKMLQFYSDYRMIVDYTSGSRSLSAGLAYLAIYFETELITVTGQRANGLISQGTEIIKPQNAYFIYDTLNLYVMSGLFNSSRFNNGLKYCAKLVGPEIDKDFFNNLFLAYDYFDSGRFELAYEHLKMLNMDDPYIKEVRPQIQLNYVALGTIANSYDEYMKGCYILASLINNADRRADENLYDDAIARLYRVLELTAQIKLDKYGINTSDVDIELLKEKGVSEEFIGTILKLEEDGKIKLGLVKDYNLLYELDDPLGKFFKEHEKRIIDFTKHRNSSILAHGLTPQSKEDFDRFRDFIVDIAFRLDKKINKHIKETKFPVFKRD